MRRNGFFAGVIATLLAVVISFGAYRFVVNRSEYLNGVGRIPGGDFNALISLPDGVDLTFPELIGKMIGPQIKGNRVLMIGDSIFASTSSRYGNEMCSTLTKLGWQVAVEAQAGEFIGFGSKVLGRRWEEGWDTAVVFLGTNNVCQVRVFIQEFPEVCCDFLGTSMVLICGVFASICIIVAALI